MDRERSGRAHEHTRELPPPDLGLDALPCHAVAIQDLVRAEMIGRAAKTELRRLLRASPARTSWAAIVAHFVNCFLGATPCGPWTPAAAAAATTTATVGAGTGNGSPSTKGAAHSKAHKHKHKGKQGSSPPSAAAKLAAPVAPAAATARAVDPILGFAMPAPADLLATVSTESVWSQIVHLVRERFRYDLPGPWRGPSAPLNRMGALRGLCLAVGVQVACRPLHFNAPDGRVLKPDDVVGLHPVVTHHYGQVRGRATAGRPAGPRALFTASGLDRRGGAPGAALAQPVPDVVNLFDAGRARQLHGTSPSVGRALG